MGKFTYPYGDFGFGLAGEAKCNTASTFPGTKMKFDTSCLINENLELLDKCAKFSGLPVMKLSIPTTSCPSSNNRSHKCEPKNPAAPVINILITIYLQSIRLVNSSPVICCATPVPTSIIQIFPLYMSATV